MDPMPIRRRAFTLVEMMVVVAILCLLLAVLLPVYSNAKVGGRITRSSSNLHQIHLALMLYAESYEGGPSGLGLPPSLLTLLELRMVPEAILHTGGTSLTPSPSGDCYVYFPPNPDNAPPAAFEAWRQHVARTGGNPILAIDRTQNPPLEVNNPFYAREAIGLWFDGHVRRRRVRGEISVPEAWEGF